MTPSLALRLAAALALAPMVLVARSSGAQILPGGGHRPGAADAAGRYAVQAREEIDGLLGRYAEAWLSDDAVALAAMYAPTVELRAGGDTLRGRARVQERLRAILPRMRTIGLDVEEFDLAGDEVYVLGRARLEVMMPAGLVRLEAPFTMVFGRGFPEPWQITWQTLAVRLHPETIAASPGARVVAREAGELRAGDILPHAAALREGESLYLVYTVRGGRRVPEHLMTRVLERDVAAGRGILRIVRRVEGRGDGGEVHADTATVDARTLQSIAWRAGQRDERLVFAPDRVRGTTRRTGSRLEIDVHLLDPVYFVETIPAVAQSLELRPAAVARFWCYVPGRPVDMVTTRVVAEEVLPLPTGGLETWVVTVHGLETPVTLWIEKATRELVRMMEELPDGGVRWTERLLFAPTDRGR